MSKVDYVFLSPPWGGLEYKNSRNYSLKKMVTPDIHDVIRKSLSFGKNIMFFLPRLIDVKELFELIYDVTEQDFIFLDIHILESANKIKAILLLFGPNVSQINKTEIDNFISMITRETNLTDEVVSSENKLHGDIDVDYKETTIITRKNSYESTNDHEIKHENSFGNSIYNNCNNNCENLHKMQCDVSDNKNENCNNSENLEEKYEKNKTNEHNNEYSLTYIPANLEMKTHNTINNTGLNTNDESTENSNKNNINVINEINHNNKFKKYFNNYSSNSFQQKMDKSVGKLKYMKTKLLKSSNYSKSIKSESNFEFQTKVNKDSNCSYFNKENADNSYLDINNNINNNNNSNNLIYLKEKQREKEEMHKKILIKIFSVIGTKKFFEAMIKYKEKYESCDLKKKFKNYLPKGGNCQELISFFLNEILTDKQTTRINL